MVEPKQSFPDFVRDFDDLIHMTKISGQTATYHLTDEGAKCP
jgi:hypothetical protein